MRVLLIEDSKRLQQSISTALRRSGYAVDASGDGEEGLWQAQSNPYDVIVLDLMLPTLDGMEVLRRLRTTGNRAAVLILSARDAVDDRVRGLQAGADDYLVKPFALEELLARVETLCRRKYLQPDPRVKIADLIIDTARKEVRRAGKLVDLTPREYRLLEFLALRAGQVVSRTEIEEHIYDERVEPMSNVVDSAICNLRRKVDIPGSTPLLKTRRGMGYLLATESEPVEQLQQLHETAAV
jgi:DNA-binding response OmpR family regulator